MVSPNKLDRVRKAFDFFTQRADDQATFSRSDIISATGWSIASVRTYTTKQWRDFLLQEPPGVLRVRHEFKRLSWESFQELITQKRKIFSKYKRVEFARVVSYEFLLPLTKEKELRDALDSLFYADTIRRRLLELGFAALADLFPRENGLSNDDYLDEVVAAVGERFQGYSILHVSGRFRTGGLATREGAAELFARDLPYLIDETTALVRFIIPLESTARQDQNIAGAFSFHDVGDEDALKVEIKQVRGAFFNLFAEAIVRTVKGEDAIWLMEDSGSFRRLFVWAKA